MGLDEDDRARLIARARTLQGAANYVGALDLATEGLARWPDELELHYLRTLALASCGSTAAALALYRRSPLATSRVLDHLALEARLLKDLAWQDISAERRVTLTQAAASYERVYEHALLSENASDRAQGTYPAVNAATLWALAGEESRSRTLAAATTELLRDVAVSALSARDLYFYWATVAEAAALLCDDSTLREAVSHANALERRNLWVRSRTHAQLARLAEVRPDLARTLERWYLPAVGVLASEPFAPGGGAAWADHTLESDPVLIFCGAPGSDLAALVARFRGSAALHVILPQATADLAAGGLDPGTTPLDSSVDVSGLHLDPSEGSTEERETICRQVALGSSISRALQLGVPWCALSLRSGSMQQLCLLRAPQLRAVASERVFLPPTGPRRLGDRPHTEQTAILFADLVGYSHFSAAQIHYYWNALMPRIAETLARYGTSVLLKKTWGDALHAVIEHGVTAARIACAVRDAAADASRSISGSGVTLYRVALHWGPVEPGIDPIDGRTSFYGPQLSLAARAEPVTPPGGIYVTEPFAARLALEGETEFSCAYVGKITLPKSFGQMRLLSLQQTIG
jgi:adenylate cyclase